MITQPQPRFVHLGLTLLWSRNESSPIVRGEEHKSVLTDAQLLKVVQDLPHTIIDFSHGVPIAEAKADAKRFKKQQKLQSGREQNALQLATKLLVGEFCTCAAEMLPLHNR